MPEDSLEFLGRHIRAERVRCNLTQQELADQSGLAVKTIQDIEKGRKNPKMSQVFLRGMVVKRGGGCVDK